MGIALAGHRNRNEMGCFIAGINPKGAASSLNFKVGDEILEVRKTDRQKKNSQNPIEKRFSHIYCICY